MFETFSKTSESDLDFNLNLMLSKATAFNYSLYIYSGGHSSKDIKRINCMYNLSEIFVVNIFPTFLKILFFWHSRKYFGLYKLNDSSRFLEIREFYLTDRRGTIYLINKNDESLFLENVDHFGEIELQKIETMDIFVYTFEEFDDYTVHSFHDNSVRKISDNFVAGENDMPKL